MLKQVLLIMALLGPGLAEIVRTRATCTASADDIYQFSVTELGGGIVGGQISFADYKGEVLLIYNVASYSQYAVDSYAQIDSLLATYAGQSLTILAFPCHQFGKKEPGIGKDEIINAIKHVNPGTGSVPDIQFFEKSQINGDGEAPIYTWMKGNCDILRDDWIQGDLYYDPIQIGDISGNFEKFLIGRDGKSYSRFGSTVVDPADLYEDIDFLLNEAVPSDL